jgi:hypothetical protein
MIKMGMHGRKVFNLRLGLGKRLPLPPEIGSRSAHGAFDYSGLFPAHDVEMEVAVAQAGNIFRKVYHECSSFNPLVLVVLQTTSLSFGRVLSISKVAQHQKKCTPIVDVQSFLSVNVLKEIRLPGEKYQSRPILSIAGFYLGKVGFAYDPARES